MKEEILVVGTEVGSVNLINTRSEERSVREVHSDAVTSITFVKDFIVNVYSFQI